MASGMFGGWFSRYKVSDKTLGRILKIGVFIVLPVTFLFSSCAAYYAVEANNRPMPDVQSEVTINNNIRFFTTNFLQVYFSGSERIDTEQLESMVTDGISVDLPVEPMSVDFINVDSVETLATGSTTRGLYRVQANVTLTAPGDASTTRNKYVLEVVRAGSNYAVAKLPEITQYESHRVQSSQDLAAQVSVNGKLGEAITNFASAYYVSSNAPSLGRFVTSGFDREPVRDSPYTAVQIERIQAPKPVDGEGGSGGSDGEAITVLVTLRGVVTNNTFNLMQVLLRVVKQDGKWVVDDIGKRVPISNIRVQDGAATTTTNNPFGGYTTPTMTDTEAPEDSSDTSTTPTTSGSSDSDDDTTTSSGR